MTSSIFRTHLEATFTECLCTSCERRGCKLGLDSLPRRSLTVIDADKYKQCSKFKGKLCDYILFYWMANTAVAVVELKSGLVKVSEAKKQIENGSTVAQQIIGCSHVSDFFPILLHGRGTKRLQIEALKKVKVRFQGVDYMIIIERCGSQLRDIFSQYAKC